MTSITLRRNVAHPYRWLGLTLLVVALFAFGTWLLRDSIQLFGPATATLEQVLWTSDPDYQTFYGPRTPESLALAHKLIDGGYLGKDFKVPKIPVYIAPPTSQKIIHANDPAVIYNFNLDLAKMLRKTHQKNRNSLKSGGGDIRVKSPGS